MSREVVINSDVSGKPGAKTYELLWDSQRWEVDLLDSEGKSILEIFKQHGRMIEEPTRGGRGNRSLEGRIRNLPKTGPGT